MPLTVRFPLLACLLPLLVWLLWLPAPASAQGAPRLGNLTYRVPPGWTAQTQDGILVLVPGDLPAGQTAFILLAPDQPLSGTLRAWFGERTAGVQRGLQVVSTTDIDQGAGGSAVLSQGAVVVGRAGETQYHLYVAGELGQGQGRRAVFLLYQASSLALVQRYQSGLTALADSVNLAAPVQAGAPTAPAAALPPVRTLNAAEFVKAGGDPQATLIPGEFRCYEERGGDDVARPHLTVQILPGGKYRTALGSGTFTTRGDGSLSRIRWRGGPLEDTYEPYLSFGAYGQDFSLSDVGGDDGRDYECYQAGAREDLARLEFALKTPKVGQYPCVTTDGSGRSAGTLELRPGGRYRFGGGEGRYTVNLLGDQDDDWSDVDFVGGPWDEDRALYSEGEDGERSFSGVGKLTCRTVVKPTPIPRFGTAKAPAPPKGSGGLSGAYASWNVDPLGYGGCGGLCWDFYLFHPNGYVYTDEPDTGLEDADCSRTHPNGLPVCEVYTFQNGLLKVGNGKAEPLKKGANGDLDLGGTTLIAIRPVTGLKLSGPYRSFSASVAIGGLSSGYSEAYLRFSPDGRFTREASGGFSATFTDTGTSSGTTTGGVTTSSARSSGGTYRFVGNTLELKYADGRVVRSFAFLGDPPKNGKVSTGLLRVGGRDYTRQDGK